MAIENAESGEIKQEIKQGSRMTACDRLQETNEEIKDAATGHVRLEQTRCFNSEFDDGGDGSIQQAQSYAMDTALKQEQDTTESLDISGWAMLQPSQDAQQLGLSESSMELELAVDNANVCEDDLICNICGKMFQQIKNVNRHKMSCHNIMDPCHMCSVCGVVCKRKDSLQRHLKTHNPSHISFTCEVCGKGFQRKDKYNKHKRVVHPDHNG